MHAAIEAFNAHLREITRPYRERPLVETNTMFAAVNTVADWTWIAQSRLVETWGAQDIVKGLVLPPLADSPDPPEPAGVLALALPSFVSARLLSLDSIDSAVLKQMIIRGFDPRLRRWSAERQLDATDAEIVARARIMVAARALEPAHGAEAARVLSGHRDTDNRVLLAAIGSALSQMPRHDGWFAQDATSRVSLAGLDDVVVRPGASPSTRAIAAHTAWLFAAHTWPPPAGLSQREEHAFELLRAAGSPVRGCIPTLFIGSTDCQCPRLSRFF